ncbi:thioredoxin reductase-like selenoprotein T homolog CG3887 [Photinus pyralis]|uniref:Selenoprotein T n=1 Tax=Photinus pyralis TaxID=7054 RepID=A0A1Y1L312_PHOPY|nr:thioredoxin reductase-like selenoprotein T homolog CG3887 [Photinus pyralis]
MLTNLKFNYSWLLIAVVLLALLDSLQEANADDVPKSKLSQNIGGPTMKFLYCYSCGYRKMYDEYAQIIQQKYPYMAVEGQNYDPPGLNMLLSRLIGIAKMLVICCILGGVNIFQYINQPQPSWWSWCIENKIYACLMLFFFCNLIEGQLIQSGAFEISLNDVPVWSKLETGRIPQPPELFQIIDSHMQFTDRSVEFNNGFAK